MTTKLKGIVEDKVRQLLDGANPTPKRIEDLMAELEQRRAADAARLAGDPKRAEAVERVTDAAVFGDVRVLADGSMRLGVDGEATIETPPAPERIEATKALIEQEMPAIEAQAREKGPISAEQEMRRMIEVQARTLRMMEEKIADLSKKQDPLAVDQAIGAGKLPPPNTPAPPPAGGTGFNKLPVGQWIKSPLGPPVPFIICGCGQCTAHRLLHYYCAVCKSGPHDYRQRTPFFTKGWMAPGGIWGVNHHACSMVCHQQYMSMIGMRPGSEPGPMPAVTSVGGVDTPSRPVIALDSE